MSANRHSVLFAGICALILTMGVARYAFTPMIPYMQAQTDMGESLAGWLAGWTYIVYLTGLFMVWLMQDLRLKDYFYRYGLFLAVFSTAIMGIHENHLVWYVSRFFAGISTALGFMLSTGLVLKWLLHHQQKPNMSLHFAGAGLGIVLTAVVVELAASKAWALPWQGQWFALALFGLVMLVPAMLLLPMPGSEQIEQSRQIDRAQEPSKRWLLLLTMAYICAGFSNTVNVTFTSLMTEYVPLSGHGTWMWIYAGLAASPAPFLWQRIAKRWGYLSAIRAAFILNISSNLLMSFAQAYSAIVLSAVLFGFAFMGIVSLVLTTIGKRYRYRSTQVMAQLTLGYSLAQIVSPISSGTVAEYTGSFALSLYVISAVMILGLLCLFLMKEEVAPRQSTG